MDILVILVAAIVAISGINAKVGKANITETDSNEAGLVSFENRNEFEKWMVRFILHAFRYLLVTNW